MTTRVTGNIPADIARTLGQRRIPATACIQVATLGLACAQPNPLRQGWNYGQEKGAGFPRLFGFHAWQFASHPTLPQGKKNRGKAHFNAA